VIGVVVREQDALHVPFSEDLFPQRPGLGVADSGIDHRPARISSFLFVDQPKVDVVELERQRHREPVDPARDFNGRARRGDFGEGIRKVRNRAT
jgi:hypothetical protein